jgi:hypothetical protein
MSSRSESWGRPSRRMGDLNGRKGIPGLSASLLPKSSPESANRTRNPGSMTRPKAPRADGARFLFAEGALFEGPRSFDGHGCRFASISVRASPIGR